MNQIDEIFLLGSGFSKALAPQMPTIDDLEQELISEEDPSLANLRTFWLDQRHSSSGEISTFEHLCYLVLSRPYFFRAQEKRHYAVLQDELLNLIYTRIDKPEVQADPDLHAALYDFLEYCSYEPTKQNSRKRNLMLSFNYDLLIEKFLESYEPSRIWKYDYSLQLNEYETSHVIETRDGSHKVLEYLKLHGSFNWFLAPSADKINLSDVFHVPLSSNARELIHFDSLPVFVPMSFYKANYLKGTFFNILWNKAYSYLDLAQHINIIGYSFPESDIDNLSLFLRFKDKIRYIIVNDAQSQKRLERIFGTGRVQLMNAKEYLFQKMYAT